MTENQRANLLMRAMDKLRENHPDKPSAWIRSRAEDYVEKKLGPDPRRVAAVHDESIGSHLQDSSEKAHSRLGIASFVIATSCIAIHAFLIVLIAVNQGRVGSPVTLGIILLLIELAYLTSIGLGIGGICQRNRRKVFGIIGLSLSSLSQVVMLLVWVVSVSG